MSALGDGFRRLYGGERRSLSFREQMDVIERAAGSVTAAAREVGVDRRTWQRWRTGTIRAPRAERVERVSLTARIAQMPRATPTDASVRLNTQEPTGRRRSLGASNLQIRPGTMDDTRSTWLATGDGEATARAFRDGVGDEFYRDTYLTDDPDSLDPEYGDSPILPESVAVA